MSIHTAVAPAAPGDTPGDSNEHPQPAGRLRQPALRVREGEFADPPPPWRILDEHRDEIEERIPSVGRIRQGSFILGTGILVARNVVMTNRHVAQSFSTDIDGVPKIRVGWNPVVDFIGEEPLKLAVAHLSSSDGTDGEPTAAEHAAAPQSPGQAPTEKPHDHVHQPHEDEPCGCCEIRSIIYVDEDHDLALLRVAFDDTQGPERWRRPRPMALNTSRALIEERRPVYLIGFPKDDRTATKDEIKTVLGKKFGVKRVQPGYITRLTTGDTDTSEFEHDASTLKGNSGSCVVDVETNQVIGLHTRGSREAAGEVSFNRAIAFSRLEAPVLDMLRQVGIALSDTVAPPPQAD